jgi:hypothetical protein
VSVAKQLAEIVFDMNRSFPVFTHGWSEDILTFAEGVPDGLLTDLAALLDDSSMDRDEKIRQLIGTHNMVRWAHYGMPAFQLSHSAAAAFALTDPSAIRTVDFHAPFPTFVVQLPVPWLTTREEVQIHGLVWHELIEEGKRSLVFRAVGPSARHSHLEGILQHPSDFETIGEWMRLAEIAEEDARPLYTTIMRLLVSLCLYIGANGRGQALSNSAKRTKADASIDVTAGYIAAGVEPAIWQTGRAVKIDRALVQAAADYSESDREGRTGWKLRSRFTVRGHFRNQAHGPRHAAHRVRWIEPYWKGPKDGVGITHLYEPQEDA